MSTKAKILVEVPESLIGSTTETLWVEKAEGGYRLLNSPFYARGISYRDVVRASAVDAEMMRLEEKVSSAGHSTYRLLITDGVDWKERWAELEALGCSYEEAHNDGFRLLSVDVPPETNIHTAYTLMEAGESVGAWTFEEADVNHPL